MARTPKSKCCDGNHCFSQTASIVVLGKLDGARGTPAGDSQDEESTTYYNGLNLVESTTTAAGITNLYRYDRLGHPDSRYLFQPSSEKPFVATRAAIALYREQIHRCLMQLQALARRHDGLHYLQVFEDPDKAEALWIIKDDTGGAITALLPSDY